VLILVLPLLLVLQTAPPTATRVPQFQLRASVRDSATRAALSGAQIAVSDDRTLIATAVTDVSGRFTVAMPGPGSYSVRATRLGYAPCTQRVTLTANAADVALQLYLSTRTVQLATVRSSTTVPASLNASTGDQSFKQDAFHGAPSSTTSQIMQQAIAGAARAPTGEVHVRGQHAQYTYYVDGVPVPSGISGSLNELFDPVVVDRMDFQTGGWDAEFGNRNIAVVKVETRIPSDGFRMQTSAYAGSYQTHGQTITTSNTVGPVGMLLSVSNQSTAMRREPVMAFPETLAPINLHNDGHDLFGFAKLTWAITPRDRITLNANSSASRFEVPFDTANGANIDDIQRDANSFMNLGWHHQSQTDTTRDDALFVALYARRSGLRYSPGLGDTPQFVFFPDTSARYHVTEDRSASTFGFKVAASRSFNTLLMFKSGIEGSLVRGRELFDTRDAMSRQGPNVNSDVRGGDIGVFVQSALQVSPAFELRIGTRFDAHVAPLAPTTSQLSPRIRLNWRAGPRTNAWVYYGRLFVPANIEDFHVLASAAQGGSIGQATLPERDHFYESGVVRKIGSAVVAKVVAYHRNNSPGIDDNTLPGTALSTSVNVASVRVTGIEFVGDVRPVGPWSGYVNAALSHASARGPVTGGFFPTAYPTGAFDQDHDQRLSMLASAQYANNSWYVSATAIYGSGLTNGNPGAEPNRVGLFDFNRAVKVRPSAIGNVGVGGTVMVGRHTLHPELFVDNVLNHRYLLKGAFTSGPAVGRPRTVQMRVGAKW